MKSVRGVCVLVFGLTIAGCATIISGSDQLITVNSNVQGAEVYLSGQLLGTTPLSANVKRGQEGIMRVTADGYQPYQVALNKSINTVFFVNLLSGGAFGSSTDYSTGAMYQYEPSTFMVSLQPGEQSVAQRNDWQRREELRSFVLLNNQAIVSDLATGDGEYVDVLVDVLAVSPQGRAEAIERWRAAYAASNTVVVFAETMVAELN